MFDPFNIMKIVGLPTKIANLYPFGNFFDNQLLKYHLNNTNYTK
jgi:hypothetical protein